MIERTFDGLLAAGLGLGTAHAERREDAGQRVDQDRAHGECAGDSAGELSARAAETL